MGCPRGGGTWPWALGHLDLQVLVLIGVAGAVPGVVGAKAGAAHLAEKRGALLPPQPAKGELPGWGVAGRSPGGMLEPSPSPRTPTAWLHSGVTPFLRLPPSSGCRISPPIPGPTLWRGAGEPQMMLGTSGAPAKTLRGWTLPLSGHLGPS